MIIRNILCFIAVVLFNFFVEMYFKVQSLFYQESQRTEKSLVVIIPSYNNAYYYKRNLDSVLNQHYHNFRVIYMDDVSPDGTGDLVEAYLKSHPNGDRVNLIKNTRHKGPLGNHYDAIHSCRDEEIIVTLDGDDWFAHRDVLARINREYQENDAWLTYGNYISFPWARKGVCVPIEPAVHTASSYRQAPWVTSHVRTYYAWLFKKIKKEDLQEDGEFFAMSGDVALMLPMLEMAGERHIRFIPDVLYIYNVETPLNEYKLRALEQHRIDNVLRSKESYQKVQAR